MKTENNLVAPAGRGRMLAAVSISYQMVFIHGVIMSVVANDMMRSMALSQASMGFLGSVYLYVYAATMFLSGMIAAWLGPRLTLTTLFLISTAGCTLFACSWSYESAVVGRAITAIGMAATMTSSFTLFSRWYSSAGFARACSICFTVGGIGTFIGLALASYLNDHLGWRAVFLIFAAMTLADAIALFFCVRDWPPKAARESTRVQKVDVRQLIRGLGQAAKLADFWRICIWFACIVGTYFAFGGLWAIPWLQSVYGMSRSQAGAIVSLVGVGFVLGTPAVMWFATVVLKSYRKIAGGAGVLAVLCSLYLVIYNDGMSLPVLLVLFLMFGLFMNAPNTVMYASGRNLFGAELAGVTGGMFGCSGFLGGAILQVVNGWLLDLGVAWGWAVSAQFAFAFTPYIICGIVGAVSGFGISKKSFPGGEGR